MRVALLTHNAPVGDAIGNQVAEKVAFFLDRGADVRVFLESDRRLHPALRAHAHVVTDAGAGADAWRFLSAADLVSAEYGHSYSLLNWLPLLAGGKARVLLDYHGVTPPAFWEGNRRASAEAAARQRGLVWCADAVVVHSRFTRRELLDATRIPPAQVTELGHVIDGKRFSPAKPARGLQAHLGLGAASLLLFVGRLAPNKRVPVLVEALAHLRDLVPAVHVVIVGDTTDAYQLELQRCRERAAALGVADRLHCLGHVEEERLVEAYRSAAALVIPSRHEGFGIPVLEAMACGLPVIAARAGALPETVAGAGLTFIPDDAQDLARQIRRALYPDARHRQRPTPHRLREHFRIAVVSFRYGTDFAGGAETSLRAIAETLHLVGHRVEVFTTCTREVADWANDLPEGRSTLHGVAVHRFRVDPHDPDRHREAACAVREANGAVPAEIAQAFFAHSVQSARLLDALRQQIDRFDAVIVGPYLQGLTHTVARTFPDKTLLLPCFHEEAFARLPAAREVYARVAGILYHTPEEQEFAERDLGINHPNGGCIGTFLNMEGRSAPAAAQDLLRGVGPYVVYCGRYSEAKGVALLIQYARRYHARHPGRFRFVFLGEGEVAIPVEPWALDLGFVDDAAKRGVLAGAAALVQLSRHESLSLVALEAWAQGTPVVAHADCPVLVGQIRRSGGGRAAADFQSFAAALDDLCDHPEDWQASGLRGREFVRDHYGSRTALADRLLTVIGNMNTPVGELMRRRGPLHAARFSRHAWREQFGRLVEGLLHAAPRPYRELLEVRPRTLTRIVAGGTRTLLVPVRVLNRGTHAVVPDGPGRVVLRCRVQREDGRTVGPLAEETSLPGLLAPGRSLPAALAVPVPSAPGSYDVSFWAQRAAAPPPAEMPSPTFRLVVERTAVRVPAPCCTPHLDAAEAALVEAHRLQRLPDTYLDVTEGRFARVKRWLKRKLLGNFKHAYVDVLSRQQSAVNAKLLAALHEVTECCATLDHAVRVLKERLEDTGKTAAPRAAGVKDEVNA
jgi:glycosyltransferase involved in cell wall biosynthesis